MSSMLLITIIAALLCDFLNGCHDAANSIATIVSTRVLPAHLAVLWASFFNLIAFLFFNLKVATAVAMDLIDPQVVDTLLIFSALCASISWNLITWYWGLPSSTSHALIGSFAGAVIAKAGLHHVNWIGLSKIFISIMLSPLVGLIVGVILMVIISHLFLHAPRTRMNQIFRKLQLFSAALISLGHGGNDAQKTMGIIALLLYSNNLLGEKFFIPLWVVLSCSCTIALGTLLGGWRIVKTLGTNLTKLKPVQGFCAESAAAITLFLATLLGIPVSTTHTVTGAITGVGMLKSKAAIRWGIASRIAWSWLLTIPASALTAGIIWHIICISCNM